MLSNVIESALGGITKKTMKYSGIIIVFILLFSSQGYCQDIQTLLNEVSGVYSSNDPSGNSLIAGFTFWGLMGGIIFSSLGFGAFVYGKKNAEFKPMIIGILLLVYPYFTRGTLILYVIGISLSAALYFFRE